MNCQEYLMRKGNYDAVKRHLKTFAHRQKESCTSTSDCIRSDSASQKPLTTKRRKNNLKVFLGWLLSKRKEFYISLHVGAHRERLFSSVFRNKLFFMTIALGEKNILVRRIRFIAKKNVIFRLVLIQGFLATLILHSIEFSLASLTAKVYTATSCCHRKYLFKPFVYDNNINHQHETT